MGPHHVCTSGDKVGGAPEHLLGIRGPVQAPMKQRPVRNLFGTHGQGSSKLKFQTRICVGHAYVPAGPVDQIRSRVGYSRLVKQRPIRYLFETPRQGSSFRYFNREHSSFIHKPQNPRAFQRYPHATESPGDPPPLAIGAFNSSTHRMNLVSWDS